MTTLIDWFFEWPERVSRHIAWLAPLFARFIVGWEFLWSGWGKLQNLPAIVENFVGWHITRRTNPRALRFGRRVLRRNISLGRLPDANLRRRPWGHHDCGNRLGQVGPGGFDSYFSRVRRIGILGIIPMVGHRRRRFGIG